MSEKFPAKISARNRVTIPAHIRHKYGLEKDDYVLIDLMPLETAIDE